ncbi:hypothetical protein [Endomicrobium proavitum]|uniref:Uncharacterized protein n=1 Tax=Endomicrobium proavitum TaxID=1408281 RepID=A0A0G3WLI9_9BACT|nr:hypothetical protein [Endomicrobium proavitum]AKL98369.1 hypothetical protein Epro_0990 [Endomicrobium proavitum]
MTINNVKDWRNVFLKSFVIGFILLWASFITYLLVRDPLVAWTQRLFPIAPKYIYLSFLGAFAFFKIAVVSFFLVPAIAFHWKYIVKRNALHKG